MDLRTHTSLIAGVLCLALALSVGLRPHKRRLHWLFAVFSLSVGLWYLTTFLRRLTGELLWERLNWLCAVLVPLGAFHFFGAFVAHDSGAMRRFSRIAVGVGLGLVALVFSPAVGSLAVAAAIVIYVVVLLGVSLLELAAHGKTATSRFESGRLRYLALVGALAALFTLVDYLPYVGVDIPPVGTILVLVFLYVLSQAIVRYRLLDLYELTGRLAVLTALSFLLATVLWLLVYLAGERFYLFAVVAAWVVLLLSDPLRVKVEQRIGQVFFRERHDLERVVAELRHRLARTLELEDLAPLLLGGIESSRRVTHAALYLVDIQGRGYDRKGYVGTAPAPRLDAVSARPLLDRLRREGTVLIEAVERELDEHQQAARQREAETTVEVLQALQAMNASLCIGLQGDDGDLYGILSIRDDRFRDAFSAEEVYLFRSLTMQAAIAVENSRLYERLKQRDRLAALGEMAAGLAHEIRNPLGAIKASAQLLQEAASDESDEFLSVIVDEVDRLNRVVTSFLDYAKPSRGDPEPTDVNETVSRALQLFRPECTARGIESRLECEPGLPPVRIDIERLRQVLINLIRNALQAMESGGSLTLRTRLVEARRDADRSLEILVADTGPGLPQEVRSNLFVPFVTTKANGTGLGLAISQRIVAGAGGQIEVRTERGLGTTFVVRLPAVSSKTLGTEKPTLQGLRLAGSPDI